jgi:exonuclease III
MPVNCEHIDALNDNLDFDFFSGYNRDYVDPNINDDPYFGTKCNSKFYDIQSLSGEEFIRTSPIFLSINIQSLQSKYEQLLIEIAEFSSSNINIDVIALQEVWDIRYPELFPLPGFKPLLCKKRQGMRGGGVGFYVKDHLNAQILEEMSPFENKIIEALTIKLTYPDKKSILLSSVYRSNGLIQNVTVSQQLENFSIKFSELLSQLQNARMEAYVFIDSNIDLLKLHEPASSNYLNLVIEKSFLQGIAKATRCQNQSKTLIDHILFNKNCENVYTGTVITDVSDHFFTFIAPPAIVSIHCKTIILLYLVIIHCPILIILNCS